MNWLHKNVKNMQFLKNTPYFTQVADHAPWKSQAPTWVGVLMLSPNLYKQIHTWYLSFFLHAHILSHENFTLGKCVNLRQNCQKQYFSGSSLPSVSCSPLRTSRTPCSLQPNTFPTTFHSDIPVASCQSYHLLGVPWHPYHNGNATPPLWISLPWDWLVEERESIVNKNYLPCVYYLVK